jgi:CCR4-NOT transcription complex subunit 4
MDLSDRNFKPCPCGYQICQFCYNNIRSNPDLNGRCPACRRPYDDESVEYKSMTAEELRIEQNKQAKRERERKQKEKEKKEQDQANRKHLAGMRVIQKNLVYVVGLNPPVPQEELIPALKSEKYFGQYGKVLKVVINKRTPTTSLHHNANNGVGVYVTFSKKEEAARCISAIDGTYLDGRPLKAAFGTTKYCSAYLRGQNCPNPGCMFLHEPGEEADSYTRQDLSTRQSLRMGGSDAYRAAPFPRHVNPQHTEEIPNTNASNTASSTPTLQHQPLAGAAPLPVTASWANPKLQPTTTSPTTPSSTLANSSAFPSLAESATLQQMQQQQHEQKRKQKQQNSQHNDEFNSETAALSFLDEMVTLLKTPGPLDYKIKSDLLSDDIKSFPNLFAFVPIQTAATPKDDELTLKLVHSLISKPQVQPPVIPQTTAQQTPYQAPVTLNQQIPSQPQQVYSQSSVAQALLQQQLLQQQQQQQQQQKQQLAQPQSAAQLLFQEQMLQQTLLNKATNDRSYAATPPPPGLFQAAPVNEQVGGTASELLNHLMNGKKISA